MHFTKAFLALALVAAPIFAAPAAVAEDDHLESRATYVFCRPMKDASNMKTSGFKVDVDNAKRLAQAAGFIPGKSGDPYGYENGDNLNWGVLNCEGKNNPLFEYPIFWEGSKLQQEWKKDTKSNQQAKTPIRVVYANKEGSFIYCGIMTHQEVDKDYQGKGAFELCK
ncbi:Ribonuclease/ribotoxin [Elaphomyces granulatus]